MAVYTPSWQAIYGPAFANRGQPLTVANDKRSRGFRKMQTRALNPQRWLVEAFHINQAIEVTSGERVLYVSGQTSNDANGAPMHPDDLVAQFKLAWANLGEVLAAANMVPSNIVRLNFFTTDVDMFMAKAGEMIPVIAAAGCTPVSTLVGVTRLFDPSIMLEIEATATATA
jgi:enamine deaminase RidA (YjgF/YER057c/UK114 family)